MKALDTNVLVRFLVNDDVKQSAVTRRLLENEEKKGTMLFVSLPVTLELLYVLESVYGYSREEIIRALEMLLMLPVLNFERHEALQKLIALSSSVSCDLQDLFIGAAAYDAGCSVTVTFDKKASRSGLFELLK